MEYFDLTTQKWSCTDRDQYQFCRIISEHEFQYIQLKNVEDVEKRIGKPLHTFDLESVLQVLENNTNDEDWYEDYIDTDDYQDDAEEYFAPYGGILDGVTSERDRNQLLAECVFEQDVVMVY